jgi:hypothetical protein
MRPCPQKKTNKKLDYNYVMLEVFSTVPVWYFFFFFAVLRFELRAYTLSHSTSPFLVKGVFEIGSQGTIYLG